MQNHHEREGVLGSSDLVKNEIQAKCSSIAAANKKNDGDGGSSATEDDDAAAAANGVAK